MWYVDLCHIYTISTQYLHDIYTYLHNVYMISTQYLHNIYTISTQYLHNIHPGSWWRPTAWYAWSSWGTPGLRTPASPAVRWCADISIQYIYIYTLYPYLHPCLTCHVVPGGVLLSSMQADSRSLLP